MNKLLGFFLCGLSCLSLQAGVFDDAKFWFRGGKTSKNGTGGAVTGDFFDALHASDPSHKNHTCAVNGSTGNCVFTTDDVVVPCTGETVNMQVLNFPDLLETDDSGNTTSWPGSLTLHNLRDLLVTNGVKCTSFTVALRMKWMGNSFNSSEGCWFLCWGYDGSAGFMLGLSGGGDTDKNGKYIGNAFNCYRCDGALTAQGRPRLLNSKINDPYIRIPTNVWVDVAVSVSPSANGLSRMRFAVARSEMKKPGQYGTKDYQWEAFPQVAFGELFATNLVSQFSGGGSKPDTLQDSRFGFGRECGYHATPDYRNKAQPTNACDKVHFRGSLQQFAVWNRALSDAELLEAFGAPRPMIASVGLENDAVSEFGGVRTGTTQTFDATKPTDAQTPNLTAGDSWTVNFPVRAAEAGLAQLVRFKATSDSASGSLRLSVNGTVIGEELVVASRDACWSVPKNLLVVGSNALTLQRMDGGASPVVMDVLTLGGSWALVPDADERSSQTLLLGGGDYAPSHWLKTLTTYNHGYSKSQESTNMLIRVWMDAAAATSAKSTFSFTAKLGDRGSYPRKGVEVITFGVNGVTKKVESAVDTTVWRSGLTKTIKLEFAPGELVPGWNEISIGAPFVNTCYWTVTECKFEVGKLRKGLCLIVR